MKKSNLEKEVRFLTSLKGEAELKMLCGDDIQYEDIEQTYISIDPALTIRVRKSQSLTGTLSCYLCFKGRKVEGEGVEEEIAVSLDQVDSLIAEFGIGRTINKRRYFVKVYKALSAIEWARLTLLRKPKTNSVWEVDFFRGELEGLIIAECEYEDRADISYPQWVTTDITADHTLSNSMLAFGSPHDLRING